MNMHSNALNFALFCWGLVLLGFIHITQGYLTDTGVIITWANVDPNLCRHVASLDSNVLRNWKYNQNKSEVT